MSIENMGEFTPFVFSRWSQPPSPRGRQPSQALPRQLSQGESQAAKSVAKVLGVMRKCPSPHKTSPPSGEVASRSDDGEGSAARNSPSRGYRRASPLWDGAFGITVQFPAKTQSLRARQRLPLRGSWQNRQVLTEGVCTKKAPHPLRRENAVLRFLQVTFQYGSHRGCSSASSSCRRTSPRCRTRPPSPARS